MPTFILLVAADLYTNKVNLEVTFPAHPSLAELTRVTEATFGIEASVLRPEGRPLQPFKVARFQMYDEKSDRWVELTNAAQIVDSAQVYAFQRETAYHTETQKPIPIARRPSTGAGTTNARSPQRDRGYASDLAPMQSVQRSPMRTSRVDPQPAALPPALPDPLRRRALPEHATLDEKVRVIFEEIDINSNRVIEPEEWKRALRVLNIDFSSATVSDLFNKADLNGDGVISLNEFQSFCSGYPTLTDCMYFRTKDYWEDYARKQEIKSSTDMLEDMKERERQARLLALEAQKEVERQEKKVGQSEGELAGKAEREKELRVLLLEAQRETERTQKERADREQELSMSRERERQRQLAFLESQRDVEKMEKRLGGQDLECNKAQDKERQLQSMLLEAQRETERQHKLVQNAQVDLAQSRDREQQGNLQYVDSTRETQRLADRVAGAEMDVATKLEREREVESLHLDSQRETARAAHRRDEEERELFAQKDREQQRVLAQNDSLRMVEDQDRRVRGLESEYSQLQQRKAVVEQQEKPLLEQEVRLREQRESLEEKESRLKNDASSFFDATRGTGAASVARGGASSPPRGGDRSLLGGGSRANYDAGKATSPRRDPTGDRLAASIGSPYRTTANTTANTSSLYGARSGSRTNF